MNRNDEEFEETLKNIFNHTIIDGTFRDSLSFLGKEQGGGNPCPIIEVDLIRNHDACEVWGILWEHPQGNQEGYVMIALTHEEVCPPEQAIYGFTYEKFNQTLHHKGTTLQQIGTAIAYSKKLFEEVKGK